MKHQPRFGIELTKIEIEVVGLWVACGSLDSLVNQALLMLVGSGGTKEVLFETSTHQQLFNILLIDFLDEKVAEELSGEQASCLKGLVGAYRTASFDQNRSVEFLRKPVDALASWLDTEITVEDVWLPTIHKQLDLTIRRRESIYICGNISKHNLGRLTVAANKLVKILDRHGVTVDLAKALLVLNDFYEKFYKDIFNCHSTAITELLNNVRWGIDDYLSPEYLRAKVQDDSDPNKCSYRFPEGVTHDFGRFCYWDLMNSVSRKPFMERFIANSLFKRRY